MVLLCAEAALARLFGSAVSQTVWLIIRISVNVRRISVNVRKIRVNVRRLK